MYNLQFESQGDHLWIPFGRLHVDRSSILRESHAILQIEQTHPPNDSGRAVPGQKRT